MKFKLLLIFQVLVFSISRAQLSKIPYDAGTLEIYYSDVENVDSTSKDELYNKAREWYSKIFKSGEAVLDLESREAGKLIGKGWSEINFPSHFGVTGRRKMYFTISISVKDSRYKYEISNVYFKTYPTPEYGEYTSYPKDHFLPESKMYKKNGEVKEIPFGMYNGTLKEINEIIRSIKISMSNQSEEDDW